MASRQRHQTQQKGCLLYTSDAAYPAGLVHVFEPDVVNVWTFTPWEVAVLLIVIEPAPLVMVTLVPAVMVAGTYLEPSPIGI